MAKSVQSPADDAAPVEYAAQVAIIGSGPVGMTLALDLAGRGVEVLLVEKRAETDPPAGRCNHISARSLEIFRRLGLAAEIRQAGLAADYPHDVAYVTAMTGHELTRIRIPSRADRFSDGDYADSGWPTTEPPHRCNQIYFDPILRRHVREHPGITTLYDTEILAVSEGEDHALAVGRTLTDKREVAIRCDYIVGCDGGSSLVRKAIGASLQGDGLISQTRSVMVRAPDLRDRMRVDPAWMTWFVGNPIFGCLIALNGTDLWTFLLWLPEGVEDFEQLDPHQAIRQAFGAELDFSILTIDDWYGRRMVADRFRKGRMLICGDAAHIWIPFAGYGMNAGIADAATLAWQLAAVVNGWGDPALLDAYEAERQPVTEQVSNQAMSLALSNLDMDLAARQGDALLDEGPAGAAARRRTGDMLYRANLGQFACLGLNFGTYYQNSPVIAHEAEPAPTYDLETYTPSTVPGCRTPHFWLDAETSLYDRLGDGYTLLRFDPSVDVTALLEAAKARGVPLALLDIDVVERPAGYTTALALSRSDQHIAWRGNFVPDDPVALVDKLRGVGAGQTEKAAIPEVAAASGR